MAHSVSVFPARLAVRHLDEELAAAKAALTVAAAVKKEEGVSVSAKVAGYSLAPVVGFL